MSVSEPPLFSRAKAELGAAKTEDALRLLEDAEREAPLDAAIQRLLCSVYDTVGDPVRAAAARVAAEALEANEPLRLYNLATGYFLHGQPQFAEKWYRVTLLLDPNLSTAHQNLAVILYNNGQYEAAARHRHIAYAQQWIFVEPTTAPVATVLVTCAADIGNVPIQYLLVADRFSCIKCIIDYARPEDLQKLPAHDVVFNAIGDPDCNAANDSRLQIVLQASGRPLLNAPDSVADTRRDRLPDRLRDVDHVLVPAVYRIESNRSGSADLAQALEQRGATYPLILRPAGSHGGRGVILANGPCDLEQWVSRGQTPDETAAIYATTFYDSRGVDGHYRKYRIIFVDKHPYPYHLAISKQWLVHYFSADMRSERWKIEEERRFLEDPAAALGVKAWNAILEIGQTIGLDYAGIDFSVCPDGSLLVFEANAAMLVHPEPEGSELTYKNRHIATIVNAFEAMVVERRQP